jgi:hypothetical protein
VIAERVGMTVGQLLDQVSSAEVSEWIALFETEREEQEEAERKAQAQPAGGAEPTIGGISGALDAAREKQGLVDE